MRQSGRMGIFAGLGPNAPAKLADLAERAAEVARWLLDREEAEECSSDSAQLSSPVSF